MTTRVRATSNRWSRGLATALSLVVGAIALGGCASQGAAVTPEQGEQPILAQAAEFVEPLVTGAADVVTGAAEIVEPVVIGAIDVTGTIVKGTVDVATGVANLVLLDSGADRRANDLALLAKSEGHRIDNADIGTGAFIVSLFR